MMDAQEAIKGLDGYTEVLVSLTALLGARLFEEKSDQREALLLQLKQNQIDGKWLACEIMKDIHTVGTKADRSGDLTGISAAMQRYVAADDKANEALGKAEQGTKPNAVAAAIDRFRKAAGLDSE